MLGESPIDHTRQKARPLPRATIRIRTIPCPELFQIEAVVSVVSENERAVITALDHVLSLAGKSKSRKPGHVRIPAD